jgi:hypothetical protein
LVCCPIFQKRTHRKAQLHPLTCVCVRDTKQIEINIPFELLAHIFSFLNGKELFIVALVNTEWRSAASLVQRLDFTWCSKTQILVCSCFRLSAQYLKALPESLCRYTKLRRLKLGAWDSQYSPPLGLFQACSGDYCCHSTC